MLEQAVSRQNNLRSRRWRVVLRVIQMLLLITTAVLVVFGFTLAGVFWEADRAVFWNWCLQIVILALPAAGFALLLQAMINRLRLEYDYILQGPTFSVYRLLGNRRAWYLSFDMRSAEILAENSHEGEHPHSKTASAVIDLTRNEDAPHILLLRARDCLRGHRRKDRCLLLEMSETFYAAFRQQIQGSAT